jgi:hypothetical protein
MSLLTKTTTLRAAGEARPDGERDTRDSESYGTVTVWERMFLLTKTTTLRAASEARPDGVRDTRAIQNPTEP